MQETEKFKHNGFTVTIYIDPDPPNPRTDYDNYTVLACWHRREHLGDRQIEGMNETLFRASLEIAGEEVLALVPLYLYQHSGMTMRCEPFSCPWDSGQVGWGYVTRAAAEKIGCIPGQKYKDQDGSEKTYDTAFFEDAIRQDVKYYDAFLTGECFGYEITDEDDGDHIDSCWGFLGDVDDVRKEAASAADAAEPLGKVSSGCNASCAEG